MKYHKVAYICDGCGCEEMCANKTKEEWMKHKCHHTTEETHAKNKRARDRKFEVHVEHDGTVAYLEVERGKKVKYD